MNGLREILAFVVLCMCTGIGLANTPELTGDRPVKVFILAGQSNMEGHGQIRSLDRLGDDPKYGYLLKLLKDPDGSWAVRNDVTISYQAEQRDKQKGPLTVGWGASANEIGPEGVTYNGGSRYRPKTDGRRNDCFGGGCPYVQRSWRPS